ncbi:Asp-tRNA(Asn)/Glu-tRNA(Gln) amidotransferase A subunit family amidase [Bradyrhizobium elkanii]
MYAAESEQGRMSLNVFLLAVNVSGLPAISVPVHMAQDGLPVGVQLIGRYGDEATLLQIANRLKGALAWDKRVPPTWRLPVSAPDPQSAHS